MLVTISTTGTDLEAEAIPMFGRCPYYIFVNTETMEFEAVQNPAINAAGGAGIQASRFIFEKKAEAVLTGRVGPNAMRVLKQANIPVYQTRGRSIREEVTSFTANELKQILAPGAANVGKGQRRQTNQRSKDIDELKERAQRLRSEMAELLDQIDRLESEG